MFERELIFFSEENKMIENRSKTNGRIVLGFILLIIGILFLLDNLNYLYFDIPHIIFSFPAILIIVGILILVNSEKKGLGVLFIIIGAIWLLPRIFPWISINGGIIFSILVIALGIYILTKRRGVSRYNYNVNKRSSTGQTDASDTAAGYSQETDRIDDVAIFGGGHKLISSDNFQGGNITAIFGGSEIDLTRCKMAPGKHILEVTAIFGGTTLIVPKEWNIVINVLPLFGGFSHKGMRGPNVVINPESTLIIKGVVIMGGGEIKTY
jgi:predicted membrane protein